MYITFLNLQLKFVDIPAQFLLRSSWEKIEEMQEDMQVHTDPSIRRYLYGPQRRIARGQEQNVTENTREVIERERINMEDELYRSLDKNLNEIDVDDAAILRAELIHR